MRRFPEYYGLAARAMVFLSLGRSCAGPLAWAAAPCGWRRLALAGMSCCIGVLSAGGGIFYVDCTSGNDASAGVSRAGALKTIQQACERVQPGDTVVVEPGVYGEHVQLSKVGTVDRPITFRAEDNSESAVVISGADPRVRGRRVQWSLVDAASSLYAVPEDHDPVRVLYDDVDLFPYQSLQELKDFRLRNGTPGPRHGYFFDSRAGSLYVRLYAGGRYGAADPNRHVMKAAPVKGMGSAARFVHQPSDYNFGVLAEDVPANVVIEGFTFETPGVAGVYLKTGNVVVRNCWFRGCRWAVTGRSDEWNPAKRSNDVTVEYCDWGHFPTFDDAFDVVTAVQKLPAAEKAKLSRFYWWERKEDVQNTYETGMIGRVGDRWSVRHNFIHDTIDGITSWGTDTSRDCDISSNRFYQLIDNAVEGENHNQQMRIHDNYILDVFEAFSWQPLDGLPWPGPMWIYRNVVEDTVKGVSYFDRLGWERGCFKILAEKSNWKVKGMERVDSKYVQIPTPGFVAYNNTINMRGVLFTLGTAQRTLDNIRFINNTFIARLVVSSSVKELNFSRFTFAGNAVRLTETRDRNALHICEGVDGTSLGNDVQLIQATVGQTGISRFKKIQATGASYDAAAPELRPQVGAFLVPNEYSPPLVGPGMKAG